MTDPLDNYNSVALLFPSKYLEAADFKGQRVTVTIEHIDPRHELIREDGNDTKPLVTLKGKRKKWILSKKNGKVIAKIHGPEVKGWIGKEITLYGNREKHFGDWMIVIRVDPK